MKTAPIGVRLDDDEHSALGKAAKEDDRSKAAMGRKFIVDGLRKAGWLKGTRPKRQATKERQKEGASARTNRIGLSGRRTCPGDARTADVR